MVNKRAVGEAISWVGGLIAILMIIAFAVIAYKVGSIGEKKPITLELTSGSFSSELQRAGAYVISSDFNSGEKGKILQNAYLFGDGLLEGVGVKLGLTTLDVPLFKGYESWVIIPSSEKDYVFNLGFYLSSKINPKYLLFGLKKVAS